MQDTRDIQDSKTWFITGAARGLSLIHICRMFEEQGCGGATYVRAGAARRARGQARRVSGERAGTKRGVHCRSTCAPGFLC